MEVVKKERKPKYEVPLWIKRNLTVEEADAYFGLGQKKIKAMSNDEHCPFVLWNGTKRLIKRVAMEQYLDKMYSI